MGVRGRLNRQDGGPNHQVDKGGEGRVAGR